MPVYIRKNISYTPPSLANFIGEDDDDDFVADPEQVRDTLPQPYRTLDKVLSNILDDVWQTISSREKERLADSNLVRPPRYECSVQMKNLGKSSCLCDSEDGDYIFVGLPNGLAAVASNTQTVRAAWEDDRAEIVFIKTSTLTQSMHLISTVDDMGIARLFAYSADRFHLLKVLNEQGNDVSSNRIIASQCEISRSSDYLGIVLENPSNSNLWLEIHRLPKDIWIKELESLLPKKEVSSIQLDKQAQKTDNPVVNVEVNEDKQTEDSESSKGGLKAKSLAKQKSGMSLSKGSRKSSKAGADKTLNSLGVDNLAAVPSSMMVTDTSDKKFSPILLVLKCKPPVMPQGFSYSASTTTPIAPKKGNGTMSISQACKSADGGDVIGTGAQHLITQQHMDLRQVMFEQLHENAKKFIPRNEDNEDFVDKSFVSQPTFQFLHAGRLMTTGMEQPGQADRPLAVSVWWTGSPQLYQFSLLKTVKDVEYKADVVWPFSSPITSTAISPCSSLMAIGLESGNVVVWDRFVGIERGVFDISNSSVKDIQFLDPSICGQDNGDTPGFGSKTAFFLVVLCGDGSLYMKRCGGALCEVSRPVQLTKRNEDGQTITFLRSLTSIPRIIVYAQRDGSIYLQDVITGHVICQAILPQSHDTASPWQPIIAVGGGGQTLYVKGDVRSAVSPDAETDEGNESAVFTFQLRSFPSLDKFWNMTQEEKIPYIVPGTINTVVDQLMKQRYVGQSARKARLEDRWEFYGTELEKIKQHRASVRMMSAKSSFAESSIPRTPMLVNKSLSPTTQAVA